MQLSIFKNSKLESNMATVRQQNSTDDERCLEVLKGKYCQKFLLSLLHVFVGIGP